MREFVKEIGGDARLKIIDLQDDGGNFEFWMQADQYTFNYQQAWSFGAIGQDRIPTNRPFESGTRYFRLERGGAWQKMGDYNSQIVDDFDLRLTVNDARLGWPTSTFWVRIIRGRVDGTRRPDPQAAPSIRERFATQIHVVFDWGYDGAPYLGGAPVLESEIWISTDPNRPQNVAHNTRDHWFSNLVPGTRYYFWGKVRNVNGWSDFGARSEAETLRVPDPPHPIGWDRVRTNAVHVWFGDRWDGGTPIRERQIGYGQHPLEPEYFRGGNDADITNLAPGKKYFFWSRVRNDVGWSRWSVRREVLLTAGARVKFNGRWHRAIPYVKYKGVWKLAIPFVKYSGSWRRTGE